MADFYTSEFNIGTSAALAKVKHGADWPVVYILDNQKEAYVGETLNASIRMSQHWANPDRQRLTAINLITEDDYNKSVILDLEAFLIKHMTADDRFQLQNGNMGLQIHNYYHKEQYVARFPAIWEQLIKHKLANRSLVDIENTDKFKYSPYTSLSWDQYQTVVTLVSDLRNAIDKHQAMTAIVSGGPGTGKTVLAVYLMKLLTDRNLGLLSFSELDKETTDVFPGNEEDKLQQEKLMNALYGIPADFKIGFVVPMQSLRQTLKSVFKHTTGLSDKMIIGPTEVAKSTYDLLIVDEAHRLKRRKDLNFSGFANFDRINHDLGLPETGTELDWILKQSKYQIFFYDKLQSIKPADVEPARFEQLEQETIVKRHKLVTQFRCKGGDEYIDYIRSIFSENPPEETKSFEGYDLQLYTDVNEMIQAIKEKNTAFGLCRTVAGFAWKWYTKNDPSGYDFVFDGQGYRWNSTDKDWVNSENSVNEIGCIHTIQGYDLNYTGVIIGQEIDYDFKKQEFVVYKNLYQDLHGKGVGKDMETLKRYILNIYATLATRGIRGTYLYAVRPNLQKYLQQFVPVHLKD